MSSNNEPKPGAFSTLSIGIGGMVAGGIFAVTGLTVEITKGTAPIAFLTVLIVLCNVQQWSWALTGQPATIMARDAFFFFARRR